MKKNYYLFLLLLLPFGVQAQETNAGKKLWAKSILNQKAPELIVQEWMTQVPDSRGKFVLIDFSATWCHACRKSMPELNDYQKKYADKLTVIFITKESVEKVNVAKNFLCELSMAVDTLNRSANALVVKGIPHNLLIDPKGFVRWEGFPATRDFELSEEVLLSIFEKYSPAPADIFNRPMVRKVLPEVALSGPVKKLVEVNYLPVSKSGEITKGNFLGRRTSIFDANGNLQEEKYVRNGDTLVNFTRTVYNSSGRPQKNNSYDSAGNLYMTTVYNYDKADRLKGEVVTDANGKVDCRSSYKYDLKGNLVEENLWNSEGKTVYRTTFRYRNNRLVEKNIYDENGALSSRFTAFYNPLGQHVESSVYGRKGLMNLYVNTYDHKGNRIEERVFDLRKQLTSIYRYKFDGLGNQLEESVVNASDKPVILYEYKYDEKKQIETRRTDYGAFYLASNYADTVGADRVVWDYWNQGKPSTKYVNSYEEKDQYGNWRRRTKIANGRPMAYSEREIEYHKGLVLHQKK